jgi:hypothetical protein
VGLAGEDREGSSSSSSRACFRVSGQTCVYHRYSPLSAQR